MARSRHTIEQKLSALRMMEEETYTWKEIMEAHGVSATISMGSLEWRYSPSIRSVIGLFFVNGLRSILVIAS